MQLLVLSGEKNPRRTPATPGTSQHFEFQYAGALGQSRGGNEISQRQDVEARWSDCKVGNIFEQYWP